MFKPAEKRLLSTTVGALPTLEEADYMPVT